MKHSLLISKKKKIKTVRENINVRHVEPENLYAILT